MTQEQLLVSKWRELPLEKKQEVLDFVEFLHTKTSTTGADSTDLHKPALGERLQQIRDKIVASSIPLLSEDEVAREVAARRGGYWESE